MTEVLHANVRALRPTARELPPWPKWQTAIAEAPEEYESGSGNGDAVDEAQYTSAHDTCASHSNVVPFQLAVQEPHAALQEALDPLEFEMIIAGGRVIPIPQSQRNIRVALRRMGLTLKHDQFTNTEYLVSGARTEPLSDDNERRLWLLLDEKFRLQSTRSYFREVLLNEAHAASYHPVRQYLDSLAWDGVPRLDTWIVRHAGAVDAECVRSVSSQMGSRCCARSCLHSHF